MASSWKFHVKDRKLNFFDEDKERQSSEPFYFVQGADIQLGLKTAYENEKKGLPAPTGRYWTEEIELAERAVRCINSLQPPPSFLVICGDLCNAFPVTQNEMRAQQEEDFKAILSQLNPAIPLVCVCGNHDVGNQPTREGVAMYRSSYGDDYFSFWRGGVLFLVLNSQYYFDSSKVPEIYTEQEAWLDSTLAEGKRAGARIVVFQHIPFFINKLDDDDEYFNLPLKTRKPLLEKLLAAGVTQVFCGHLHYNAYSTYKSLEIITTSAVGYPLGKDPPGMRIVKVKGTGVDHIYQSLDDFPKVVEF